MIFVAEDVGEHGEAVAFLDEAHGHTGNVVLKRHAGIEHREAAAADGGHRRGAVRFTDFRNNAKRVLELFGRGQNSLQGALSETAVADFAALGAADAARFAGCERRHVVVQHEAVVLFFAKTVNDLFILLRAEGGRDESLRFTAGEERRAVGAREHALADFNREEDTVHFIGIGRFRAGGFSIGSERLLDEGINLAELFSARLLGADGIGFVETLVGDFDDTGNERLVLRGGLPIPGGLAGLGNEFVDRIDGDLHFTASSIVFSGRMSASDSTISTARWVPATTRSRREVLSCSVVGFTTNLSSM